MTTGVVRMLSGVYMGNAYTGRIAATTLVALLAVSPAGEPCAASRGLPRQSDARIEDTPLFTIGHDPNEPLHRVVGAVLTDGVLIIAEESTWPGPRRGRRLERVLAGGRSCRAGDRIGEAIGACRGRGYRGGAPRR